MLVIKDKDMKVKYKFSYGGFFKYLINQIVIFLGSSVEIMFVIFIISRILTLFDGDNHGNSVILNVANTFLGRATFCALPMAAILTAIPRRLILNDSFLKINRYILDPIYFTRGFNDKINYKDIIKCEKYIFCKGRLYPPYAVMPFARKDFVKIVAENDRIEKTYLVPVQNPDDFINEVWKRVQLAKSKENDETSQSAVPTNMFQFDLQRGYMPDCDEIVLGIKGVEFKTDKTTADLINVKSISYNDIQLCKKLDKHSINGIDSDNIVEITTATQTYYIPIKNPYDFINELYKKLNTCNQ